MKYSKELKTVRTAVYKAAAVIQNFAAERNFAVQSKSRNNLVTDADVAAEKIIIEIIKNAFPGDSFLAEESSAAQRLPEGRVWIIDPIDGTTNFAHSFPVYCISIALWDKKKPCLGAVYELNSRELFWAAAGEGAWLNDRKITVSSEQNPGKALIGTGFPYQELEMLDYYLNIFKELMEKTHGVRRPGSAAWDLCNVACGRLEGFYEYGLKPWDVAAAAFIVLEAGGRVEDWLGGQNWLSGQRITAGNSAVLDFLQNIIRKHIPEKMLTANV